MATMNLAVAASTPTPILAAVPLRKIKLKPMQLMPQNIKTFGQIIGPSFDGKEFDLVDAQLDLSRGIPRFYIMHLEDRKNLTFDNITHHASVTQCLGSIGGQPWYLGVAPASIVPRESDENAVWSKAGHFYVPPRLEDVRVIRVDGPNFLKLHAGVWHAGPFFTSDEMDFFNLELSDTNLVDHTMHVFRKEDGVVFEIDD